MCPIHPPNWSNPMSELKTQLLSSREGVYFFTVPTSAQSVMPDREAALSRLAEKKPDLDLTKVNVELQWESEMFSSEEFGDQALLRKEAVHVVGVPYGAVDETGSNASVFKRKIKLVRDEHEACIHGRIRILDGESFELI